MSEPQVIRVSKLDAARRQLDGAIELWFSDGDPVAIHALVCAAHQIIQDINEKRGDTILRLTELVGKDVKPEHIEDAIRQIRKPTMFFKHANRDPYDVIEFTPGLSQLFILLAINGLRLLGEQLSDFHRVFLFWDSIHEPRLYGGEPLQTHLSVQQINQFKLVKKREFLEQSLLAIAEARVTG
ncbi:MAG: hypothetical protein ACT4QB_05295 [Gammaproteobacteria bacterium]